MNIRSFITLAAFVKKRFSMCLSRYEQLKKLIRGVKTSFEMIFGFSKWIKDTHIHSIFYALKLIRNQYKILDIFILYLFTHFKHKPKGSVLIKISI